MDEGKSILHVSSQGLRPNVIKYEENNTWNTFEDIASIPKKMRVTIKIGEDSPIKVETR
jgi:hypothetical protein